MRAHLLAVISLGGLVAGCSADWSQVSGEQVELAGVERGRVETMPASTGRDVSAVAAFPDRGSLFGYDRTRDAVRTGAVTWHPVKLSEDHALRAAVSGGMVVEAPNGQQIRLKFERKIEHPDGNWTWIGRPVGTGPGIEAIVTFGEKAVFGSIPYGKEAPLQLTMARGRTWLIETDRRALDQQATPTAEPDFIVPMSLANAAGRVATTGSLATKALTTQAATVTKAAAPATVANTVDVVIGYTVGFAQSLGGASQALTRLNFLVDTTNQAYSNSEVSGQVRIMQAIQVNYPDATANRTTLFALTGVNCVQAPGGQLPDGGVSCTSAARPAALQPLITAREQHGADLVALVRMFETPEQQSCGLGWMLGGGQTAIGTASSSFGMSVISDSSGTATPNACRNDIFAHELGHNMGLQHDRETAQGTDDTNGDTNLLDPEEFGRHPYSFGYSAAVGAGDFHDVMAIRRPGQTSYLVFSNPRINFCGNLACGVANQADSALSLALNLPFVAGFRVPATPIGNTWLRGDFTGDGRADVFWRNRSTGANSIWPSGSATGVVALTAVTDQAWNVVGVGNFNGDARADLLWRNSITGANSIWPSGSATGVVVLTAVPNQAWNVVGVGDFNNDGRADILWRNSATGANSIWRSGSASNVQAVTTVGLVWRVVGVGDFDGDHFSDILWRNTATGANSIWRSGNSAQARVLTAVNTTWRVAGVGDFDADGRADILWRNGVAGQNTIWPAGNSTGARILTPVADLRWVVVGVGDFDDDGRADIWWRNFGTGANSIWRSGNSATGQLLAPVNTPNWIVSG